MGFWGGTPPSNGVDPDVHMPWQVEINALTYSGSNRSWSTYNGISNYQLVDPMLYGVMLYNPPNGAQGDWLEFDVTLSAGTWSLVMCHYCEHNQAIRSVYIDGTLVGTIDGYANPGEHDRVDTIVGIVVESTGRHALRIVAATRNGACDGWLLGLQHLTFRRTE